MLSWKSYYLEYVMSFQMFFQKKADTLSIYYLYNLVINIKNIYQVFLAVMYRMSKNEI